jgi:hypothetical protein
MIDYALAKKEGPKLKATLTRAIKKGNYEAVLNACRYAVSRWKVWGAWPDNWNCWQIAIIDAANEHTRKTGVFVNAPRLESLERIPHE